MSAQGACEAPGAGAPRCCDLAAANLAWFPRSGAGGAWHAVSFARDPRRDAPASEAYVACPFCGAALPAPSHGPARGGSP